MRDEISTGMRMQRAMENTGLFPNMVVQMIAVGEESGSLDEMASKVADFYEADVDAAVDGLSQPARAADHGDPGHAGRRPRDRDVPADLQARRGHLTRPARQAAENAARCAAFSFVRSSSTCLGRIGRLAAA